MSTCYVTVILGYGGRPSDPAGTRKVRAEAVNRHFAIHRFLRGGGTPEYPVRDDADVWSLTHRHTGWKIATLSTKTAARRLAQKLIRLGHEHRVNWGFTDPLEPRRTWEAKARAAIAAAVSASPRVEPL